MDDLDQYDSASQYGQGFDDTASMVSGYTMRTQKTATTALLSLDELSLTDGEPHNLEYSNPGVEVTRVPRVDDDGAIELEGNIREDQELPADLPPHACRCATRHLPARHTLYPPHR